MGWCNQMWGLQNHHKNTGHVHMQLPKVNSRCALNLSCFLQWVQCYIMWLPYISVWPNDMHFKSSVPFLFIRHSAFTENYHFFVSILRIPILLVSWWVRLDWGWPVWPSDQARKGLNRPTGPTVCCLRCSPHNIIWLGKKAPKSCPGNSAIRKETHMATGYRWRN